jgi:hypothetical protein
MHGVGTFFDARFDNAAQFPVAAAAGLGHVSVGPDDDRVTSKLPALQFYQLALPPPKPRPNVDFDADAAERGDALFSGRPTATPAIANPCGPSRAGTTTSPRTSTSRASRPIARQITPTAR